jgi:DNA sulfur modification protein DndB
VTPDKDILDEEVNTIFVAHDASSEEGKKRTRRLFTTLNKKAKRISKAATIALDEDNGFAILTRQLIDEYSLFEDDRKHISYSSSGAINPSDENTISSVVGLYEILKDLYPAKGKKQFETQRPEDSSLKDWLKFYKNYFDLLIKNIPEYNKCFKQKKCNVSDYRKDGNHHLLFRPVGQRAFAKAVQLLIFRGLDLTTAIKTLISIEMALEKIPWQYILWDPVNKSMITNKAVLAETQLLRLAGLDARTTLHKTKLDEFLSSLNDVQ